MKKSMDKDGGYQANDFMHYDILLSPEGDYESIRKGWSWEAFFFNVVWALLNKMWYLGTILWLLGWFWFMINVDLYLERPARLPALIVMYGGVVGLIVGSIFGILGNKWKKKKLLARGYEEVSTVTASISEEAIANFIEISGEDGVTINGNYNIFSNPLGNHEAVKKGWSWTAFFFVFVWALFNKMWALGGVGWTLWIIWNYFLVTVLFEGSSLIFLLLFQIMSGLYVALIFGILGNEWKRYNFLTRGYEEISSVTASTPEGAIAIFLELAEKDKVTEDLQSAVVAKNSTESVDKQHFVDELKKLAELKNDGLLTEEEFSAGKNKLLNG